MGQRWTPSLRSVKGRLRGRYRSSRHQLGQAAAGLKRLAFANCTPDELAVCHRWIKTDPFWRTKPVSTQTIFNQMGEWHRLQTLRAGSIDTLKLNEHGYMPTGTGNSLRQGRYGSAVFVNESGVPLAQEKGDHFESDNRKS